MGRDGQGNVVEIDGDIAELAKEHFDIGGARVIVGDGAKFVKESDSRNDEYDRAPLYHYL